MVDIKDKVDKEENEQLRSIPAQRLIEKLSLLKNRVNEAKKRWFWELLQNASDYNETINVKLTVSDEKITFSHDGAPFSLRDALNLISPDSNKQDDKVHKDNIGKFGTGLVSTHILSSVLDVEGFCIDDEKVCYKFAISLDRSCFKNKQELIEQITRAKECFKESLEKHPHQQGFNTLFSYRLGLSLPDLAPLAPSDVDLKYLYEVLPYTLCFMPKVQSVIVEDNRRDAQTKHFKISRNTIVEEQKKVFTIETDSGGKNLHFAYFDIDNVSTVFRFENDEIMPFPKDLSRVFCGLPLIGTEEIGLPFLVNSLNFKPTTEREGIELEPSSNEENRKLFRTSIGLYGKMLEFVANNKMKKAFYLTKMSNKYNGTQISNQQFYSVYLTEYKRQLLNHRVVLNEDGQFVSFSNIILPFNESKPDVDLYKNCKFLNSSSLPAEEDYQAWFDATDFIIFKEQKYTYDNFARLIDSKVNIYSFGKTADEVLAWLYECAGYFKACDRYIFQRYRLLPNQTGNLCAANSQLYADVNLPTELKDIYDILYGINSKIGNRLLNKEFNKLEILCCEYTLEMLATAIDNELAFQFAKNQGNVSVISSSLNKLYNWVNNADIPKERLSAYFQWYYPKRAALIVDLLSESQREQALVIAQSGKMESLAHLASSELTNEELQLIVANIKKLPAALSLLAEKVDDKVFADSTEGEIGEEIVYNDLMSKFPVSKGYRVSWASKNRGEACYDFEITKNGVPFAYCDAKTTSRGIANSDSIPFFMRKSQWEFLKNLDNSTLYLVARVFMGEGREIKYMRILTNVL